MHDRARPSGLLHGDPGGQRDPRRALVAAILQLDGSPGPANMTSSLHSRIGDSYVPRPPLAAGATTNGVTRIAFASVAVRPAAVTVTAAGPTVCLDRHHPRISVAEA